MDDDDVAELVIGHGYRPEQVCMQLGITFIGAHERGNRNKKKGGKEAEIRCSEDFLGLNMEFLR